MVDIIAWDSCVLIDAIQKKDGIYEHIETMIRKAEAGELYIVVSSVSVAEIQYLGELSATGLSKVEQNTLIDSWMDQPYIVIRSADRATCRQAALLAQQSNSMGYGKLTPIDSIILATAIKHEAETLVTLDGKNKSSGLIKFSGKFGSPALNIRTPDDWSKQSEFVGGGF
ncbi:MAG: PIN domain-containing protein [Candidatus Thiodiazotropha sp.]